MGFKNDYIFQKQAKSTALFNLLTSSLINNDRFILFVEQDTSWISSFSTVTSIVFSFVACKTGFTTLGSYWLYAIIISPIASSYLTSANLKPPDYRTLRLDGRIWKNRSLIITFARRLFQENRENYTRAGDYRLKWWLLTPQLIKYSYE